jgi:hypothetical protein
MQYCDCKPFIEKKVTPTEYNPYVSTLTPELKEKIRQKYNFVEIKEIEDRIKQYDEKFSLIGGYHYTLATTQNKTQQDRLDWDYINLKLSYNHEINKYKPTDSYLIFKNSKKQPFQKIKQYQKVK